MKEPRTLFEKVWDAHEVVRGEDGRPDILYIDLHLIHEVTSPQAFAGLETRNLGVRRPDRTLGTMDHSTPTTRLEVVDSQAAHQLRQLEQNCVRHGIELHRMGSPGNGIVHVIGPELGRTQPGMTVVCGDSHTSTHGAFGALAFGIGTSEVEHVLATQCLLQKRPKPFRINVDGRLGVGVTAKDVILAIIERLGTDGGTGTVLEFTGPAIRSLDMEARMTICNMSIEAGARAGMIAPDDTTFEYLAQRPAAPKGAEWDRAMENWKSLHTDPGAEFAKSMTIDVTDLRPMVTFGTHPGMSISVDGVIPEPNSSTTDHQQLRKALAYMNLVPGRPIQEQAVDVVFLGSCTNSRMVDLRAAARLLEGRKVSENVRMIVVPGSARIKSEAEAEGLDAVFRSAGAEWRQPGCSLCIAMNGDQLAPGQYAVSTSNRNFEGRQGPGGRTFLASPLTAAASAVTGRVTDPRPFLENRT
ncbi:MAG: 3-isopropylmalate dehydratase large subunit [Myxococcota bacterium]